MDRTFSAEWIPVGQASQAFDHMRGTDENLGVQRLCSVMSDLSIIDERIFKVKNRRLWQSGEPYYEIKYQVKVIIGAADLHFELCL